MGRGQLGWRRGAPEGGARRGHAGRRGWAPQGAVSASGSAWSRAAPARRFWNLTGLWPSAPSGIPAAAFWSWGPTPELRKPQHPFVVWWRCRGSAPLPELRRRPARTCGSSAEGVELAVASEAAARAPTQKRGTGPHRPLDHPPRRLPISSWGHRVNHPSWSTFCRVTSPPAFLAARRGAQLLSSRGAPGARCSPGPLRPLPSGPRCTHSQPPAPLSALRTRPSGAGPEWSYVSHSAGCIIPRPLAFPLYGSHSLALASSPFQLCATVALSSPPRPAPPRMLDLCGNRAAESSSSHSPGRSFQTFTSARSCRSVASSVGPLSPPEKETARRRPLPEDPPLLTFPGPRFPPALLLGCPGPARRTRPSRVDLLLSLSCWLPAPGSFSSHLKNYLESTGFAPPESFCPMCLLRCSSRASEAVYEPVRKGSNRAGGTVRCLLRPRPELG